MTDLGQEIRRLADTLTPEQTGELHAIQWLETAGPASRTPILKSHETSETVGPLIQKGLITWDMPRPPFSKKTWRMPNTTKLGRLVLHAIAEDAMRATGRLPPIEPPEEE